MEVVAQAPGTDITANTTIVAYHESVYVLQVKPWIPETYIATKYP